MKNKALEMEVVDLPTKKERKPRGELKEVPELKSGRDSEQVAQVLDGLIGEAESGLKRIVMCGLYILSVQEDLPHGSFEKWYSTYLPHRNKRSIQRWKKAALNVMEICGYKVTESKWLKNDTVSLLTLPAPVEKKITEVVEGKTMKQLMFEFKELDDNGLPLKRYHETKKDGTPRADRRTAEEMLIDEAAMDGENRLKQLFRINELIPYFPDKISEILHGLLYDAYQHSLKNMKLRRLKIKEGA